MGWKVRVTSATLNQACPGYEFWISSYFQDSIIYVDNANQAAEFTDRVDLIFLERHCKKSLPDIKFHFIPVLRVIKGDQS